MGVSPGSFRSSDCELVMARAGGVDNFLLQLLLLLLLLLSLCISADLHFREHSNYIPLQAGCCIYSWFVRVLLLMLTRYNTIS